MGASSGWNLVARRPPRSRAASKPARHLVLVPRTPSADVGRVRADRASTPPPRDEPTRDAG
jgi:hypothetical protein